MGPQPFQETMSRFGTEERAFAEVPLYPFFFDVLHVDGIDLIDLPLAERLAHLDRIAPTEHRIARIATSDVERRLSFSEGALEAGHEGVMVKVARLEVRSRPTGASPGGRSSRSIPMT